MRTKNVNTATNESAEHFYQEFTESCRVVQPKTKLKVVPFLFCSPAGDTLVADWLRRHSDYDGGNWDYFLIPKGLQGKIAADTIISTQVITGFIAPAGELNFKLDIPGNYFSAEVSAQAAGIIATLMVMNQLSWKLSEMGPTCSEMCDGLIARQDAIKDYISIIKHPQRALIWRAID
ncbi:antirestriction protein [Enterobacter cloacae complex sp. I2]|uniref:antirestriction protein n=1 Tax=Enterobacter cloacae complex sp. I2 TaxID=2779603 RepID=UPI001869249C|nr:antirestriction protein [Enterobacter cloacae complex sp. I2]MBE3513082.1 antirestriction protein [Enterobacter cloacae complex sp. I2]